MKLSPREYDLLRLLVAHAGKVLTHRFILREVWGTETDVQYLRIYIRALRQKIEADPDRPQTDPDGAGRGLSAAGAGLERFLTCEAGEVDRARSATDGGWPPPSRDFVACDTSPASGGG